MEESTTWKTDLRKEMIAKRLQQNQTQEQQRNQSILKQAILLLEEVNPEWVYCYVDFNHEVATKDLICHCLACGISVAVPRVEGKQIFFYRIQSVQDLVPGTWGILEPGPHCEQAMADLALVFVPGLAFTRQGKRLGYGGGYYDKFFQREPKHQKVALAYSFQLVEQLPTEDYDVDMDQVIVSDEVNGRKERGLC